MSTHSIWFDLIITLCFWGGAIAFAIGLCIVVTPGLVFRFADVMNRWISTDKMFRDLDQSRPSERLFYRHHRIAGALLAAGAAYVLYTFAFGFDAAALSQRVVLFGSRAATEWLFYSLSVINLIFAALALVTGCLVFVRPSLLKRAEAAANRWFAADDSLRRLDVQMRAPDRLFLRHPRLMGVLIMAGSLYILANLRLFV